MRRRTFLPILSLIVVLVVALPAVVEKQWPDSTWPFITEILLSTGIWAVFWFRLKFLSYRPEVSILPVLPFFIHSINSFLQDGNAGANTGSPLFNILMAIAWIGTPFVVFFSSLPDDKKKEDRWKFDGITIVISVFIFYFSISYIYQHIMFAING